MGFVNAFMTRVKLPGTCLRDISACVQAIGRDDLDEDGEPAHWARRHTLRPGPRAGMVDAPGFLASKARTLTRVLIPHPVIQTQPGTRPQCSEPTHVLQDGNPRLGKVDAPVSGGPLWIATCPRSSGPGEHHALREHLALQAALVLEAGKHQAAIRECGRSVQRPLPEDVRIGALTRPLACIAGS